MKKLHTIAIGASVGRLTITGISEENKISRRVRWVCACSCGNSCIKSTAALEQAENPSCGCSQRERLSNVRTRHGHAVKRSCTEFRTYITWQSMKWRCENKARKDYANYGGRGISVCERWKEYELFLADMGMVPGVGMSIDRIDPNGNYEPGNCRWATIRQQANNRRSNRFIEFNGQRKTIAEWSRDIGCDDSAISKRLENGWSVEKTLTTPKMNRGPNSSSTRVPK